MGTHHPEEDDAPRAAGPDGAVDHDRPYGEETRTLLIDFGEVEPARLHGCPNCGNRDVSYSASKCYRCQAEFAPAYQLPPVTVDHQERSSGPQEISPSSGHAYRRISDALRRQIASGELVPGDRIPSQEELSSQYGVSRMTVRQALAVLEHEGLTKGGKGAPAVVQDVPAGGIEAVEAVVDVAAVRAELAELHSVVRDLNRRLGELRKRLD
ncbi:winged helix-turn-helix domain-containing protein [Amycolatopsis sp. NPDC051373]|uniref:winged helix-turn-helix domain-containing protein n=1 Tax=Amycolatopsis sp. NPDC051373 TaxID=3155801 RepID=UPI00344F8D63